MIDLFLKGGPLMYPLLAGSLFMLAVIIERSIVYAGTRFRQESFDTTLLSLRAGDRDQALAALVPETAVICAFLRKTINSLDKTADVLEEELSLYGEQLLDALSRRLHILSLTGRIAPMVGLTGTVMGMVQAFHKVAAENVAGKVDPSLLADGIWSALLTTVAGLFVAIPALIAHSLFESRLKSVAFQMKHYSNELVAAAGKGKQKTP